MQKVFEESIPSFEEKIRFFSVTLINKMDNKLNLKKKIGVR